MKCEKCKSSIVEGEERTHYGRLLCEDCYMDMLSPAKTCDPWAVHSAKTSLDIMGADLEFTETQEKILQLLKETGGTEPEVISKRLQIKPSDLEREIAALRHMEKVRGELRQGKRVICLW